MFCHRHTHYFILNHVRCVYLHKSIKNWSNRLDVNNILQIRTYSRWTGLRREANHDNWGWKVACNFLKNGIQHTPRLFGPIVPWSSAILGRRWVSRWCHAHNLFTYPSLKWNNLLVFRKYRSSPHSYLTYTNVSYIVHNTMKLR